MDKPQQPVPLDPRLMSREQLLQEVMYRRERDKRERDAARELDARAERRRRVRRAEHERKQRRAALYVQQRAAELLARLEPEPTAAGRRRTLAEEVREYERQQRTPERVGDLPVPALADGGAAVAETPAAVTS